MAEKIRKKEKFGDVEIETIYREARRAPATIEKGADEDLPDDPMARMGHGFCPPFNQRTYLAEDGIICEQDVPVTLRDGTVIYTDILPARRPDEHPRHHFVELLRQASG